MLSKTEINQSCVYVCAEIKNPQQMLKIRFSFSQLISADEPIERMLYQTEIDRTLVYVFAEIQNLHQMLQIQFSLSRHISAEELTEKHAS